MADYENPFSSDYLSTTHSLINHHQHQQNKQARRTDLESGVSRANDVAESLGVADGIPQPIPNGLMINHSKLTWFGRGSHISRDSNAQGGTKKPYTACIIITFVLIGSIVNVLLVAYNILFND